MNQVRIESDGTPTNTVICFGDWEITEAINEVTIRIKADDQTQVQLALAPDTPLDKAVEIIRHVEGASQ